MLVCIIFLWVPAIVVANCGLCVTAGVCEPVLMLLTLGNEEQTRTKREREIGAEERKPKEKDVVRRGMETAVPL